MKDWFVEVRMADGAQVEMFEFIDYRAALAFADRYAGKGESAAVIDFRGMEVLSIGEPFDGCPGYTSTPLSAGFYCWCERSERMLEVRA